MAITYNQLISYFIDIAFTALMIVQPKNEKLSVYT